jgi:hypothetical protein
MIRIYFLVVTLYFLFKNTLAACSRNRYFQKGGAILVPLMVQSTHSKPVAR